MPTLKFFLSVRLVVILHIAIAIQLAYCSFKLHLGNNEWCNISLRKRHSDKMPKKKKDKPTTRLGATTTNDARVATDNRRTVAGFYDVGDVLF